MVEEVETNELADALESERDPQVIDVREEHEVNTGFIPGAIHLPLSKLTLELSNQSWSDEIYIICRHGNSSLQAARLLEAYEGTSDDAFIASVAGGYLEWDGDMDRSVDEDPQSISA